MSDSTVQLSTLVFSNNMSYIAVGEGAANKNGNSLIYLYDTKQRKLI